jgi:hypothetical protein
LLCKLGRGSNSGDDDDGGGGADELSFR